MRLRILVADNSELIRRGVKMLLNGHEEISVVGEASEFRDAIRNDGRTGTRCAHAGRWNDRRRRLS